MFNKDSAREAIQSVGSTSHLSANRYDRMRDKTKYPCSATIVRLMGTWRSALLNAGALAPPPSSGRKVGSFTFSDNDIAGALSKCYTETGNCSVRSYEVWRASQADPLPSSSLIRIRFSHWSVAVKTYCS